MRRSTPAPLALAALALAMVASLAPPALAQDAAAAPAPPRDTSRRPFHLEIDGFYQSLDHGYGAWRGVDVRLQYASPRFTPFAFASSQTRDEGTQVNVGAGSYITLGPRLFAIVGASTAPENGVVLYPELRADASLYVGVPGVDGLLVSGGLTEIRYSQAGYGGRIASLGSMFYRGRGIYSGVVRFNSDRASGLHSRSYLAAGQWGEQGRYWVGASVGGGNEAYQALAASPFDARFDSRSASAFLQAWVTRAQGVTLRYDFERKLRTYTRNGITVGYFVEW
jgi:YaiO family outer membrane protein